MKHRLRRVKFGHRTVPVEKIQFFRRGLIRWWKHSQRKFPWRHRRASLYHQVVSEVLLQRTRAETVKIFWPTFIERFPNWKALADATPREIEDVLCPIGLARQRAPRLHALGKTMTERNGRFPKSRDEIESLPGIGQYIANAVFMFDHGVPKPLLDVNMARVLERYFGSKRLADIRYDPYLQSLGHSIVHYHDPASVNWAILDLAALICTPSKPLCEKCPVRRDCKYAGAKLARANRYREG